MFSRAPSGMLMPGFAARNKCNALTNLIWRNGQILPTPDGPIDLLQEIMFGHSPRRPTSIRGSDNLAFFASCVLCLRKLYLLRFIRSTMKTHSVAYTCRTGKSLIYTWAYIFRDSAPVLCLGLGSSRSAFTNIGDGVY